MHPTSAKELNSLLISEITAEAVNVATKFCDPSLSSGIVTTKWSKSFDGPTGVTELRRANVFTLASFLCFVDSIRDPNLPVLECFQKYNVGWLAFNYRRNGAMAFAGEKLLEASAHTQSRLEISCDPDLLNPSLLVSNFRNNEIHVQARAPKSWLEKMLGIFVVQELVSLVKARTDLDGIWLVTPAFKIADLRSPVWDRLNSGTFR